MRRAYLPGLLLPLLASMGCSDKTLLQPDASYAAPESPSLAASPNATTTFHEPISFTITPADCSALLTTVTGTGTSHVVVHESVQANGTIHFSFHNNIEGTATGADGSTYRFNYTHNESVTTESFDVPFEIKLVDKWHLIGQGSTPDIPVYQYYDFILNPDGTFVDLRVRVRGDPFCDPI